MNLSPKKAHRSSQTEINLPKSTKPSHGRLRCSIRWQLEQTSAMSSSRLFLSTFISEMGLVWRHSINPFPTIDLQIKSWNKWKTDGGRLTIDDGKTKPLIIVHYLSIIKNSSLLSETLYSTFAVKIIHF
jgi:hypothetical protein